MKIKRHKHTRRVLKFYKSNFNLDTKFFNILIDGTFANTALKSKVNLSEQLPKFFEVASNKCKLLTTKCALHEVELLGSVTYGAFVILKQYEIVECKHKRNFVSSEKCFKNLITDSAKNDSTTKFFVATQSESLKEIVRNCPGTPLIIMSHSAINLERPSTNSLQHVDRNTEEKLKPDEQELKNIQKLKDEILKNKNNEVKRLHKRKKAKGPNPLSCKKKQREKNNNKIKLNSN